jgi:predicted DsbA family dithiol-disulfide isomerase
VPPEGQELPFSPERLAAGRRNFERLADQAGLPYGQRTHWYDSKPAHQAYLWAEEHGAGDAFKRLVFRAYFVDDHNIASPELLAGLAAELCLDGDDLRAALADERYRERVEAEYDQARAVGVTAVPTFVAGGYALVGAHPIENLRRLLAHAGATAREATSADAPACLDARENLLGPQIRRSESGG